MLFSCYFCTGGLVFLGLANVLAYISKHLFGDEMSFERTIKTTSKLLLGACLAVALTMVALGV